MKTNLPTVYYKIQNMTDIKKHSKQKNILFKSDKHLKFTYPLRNS